MTTMTRSFSGMLRNSGDVLHELEHADVLLHRRDGEDVMMVARHRESAVRDSLSMAVRGLGAVLADADLAGRVLDALADAMPWTAWLEPQDRASFARAFVSTAQACYETDYFEPLSRLLNRWKSSAEIAHDPELSALLAADRGDDELVALDRPAE
jgi:hypothetical protein